MTAGRSEDDLWIFGRFEAGHHTELFTQNCSRWRWLFRRWRLTTVLFELQAFDCKDEGLLWPNTPLRSNQSVRICSQKQCSVCSGEWSRIDESWIFKDEPPCEVWSCLQRQGSQNSRFEFVSLLNTAKKNIWLHSWSMVRRKFLHSRSSSFRRWRLKARNVRKANHRWSGSVNIETSGIPLKSPDKLWMEWTGFIRIVCQYNFHCEQLQFNANRI